MDTEDKIVLDSDNIENAYGLIKQLKNEMLQNTATEEIINNVSELIEKNIDSEEKTEVQIEEKENCEEKKVLLISSKENKVVLPYSKENVEFLVNEGKYESEEEAIEKEYTVSLSRYKNEAISRVVEGYKLARKKDNNGIAESLKYALNLIFERRLHPAIITACNSIDELDIYLACLDENVMELFDFFEVVFDYAPLEIK